MFSLVVLFSIATYVSHPDGFGHERCAKDTRGRRDRGSVQVSCGGDAVDASRARRGYLFRKLGQDLRIAVPERQDRQRDHESGDRQPRHQRHPQLSRGSAYNPRSAATL